MCEYCRGGKQIRLHRQRTDSNITDCFIKKCNDGAAMFCVNLLCLNWMMVENYTLNKIMILYIRI